MRRSLHQVRRPHRSRGDFAEVILNRLIWSCWVVEEHSADCHNPVKRYPDAPLQPPLGDLGYLV